MSPSSRGRGLKLVAITAPCAVSTSPSSRGRGLKWCDYCRLQFFQRVALFTRAWIEILDFGFESMLEDVALFTRAWIEIMRYHYTCTYSLVALFTRAWIEITILANQGVGVGVALFTRAWIEIYQAYRKIEKNICRPLHEGVD